MSIWIVSAVLAATLYLLVSEKLPLDLTALGIIVVLMLSGLLTPKEAVVGFSNPAVVTVGAMFLLSRGMLRTGAVGFIGYKVLRMAGGNVRMALLVILLIVALASAFINNTPVVVLFIPVVMSMCCEFNLSPSKFLIPVSYASILAGTCTLVGTSTNIIVSDLSAGFGYGQLGMFELSVLGVPLALLGIGFLLLMAPRLMPELGNPSCQLEDSEHRRYLAELEIPRGSHLPGESPAGVFADRYPGVQMLELVRYSHVYYPARDRVEIAAGDILLIKGSATDLIGILNDSDVNLPLTDGGPDAGNGKREEIIVEMVIPPQSELVGERLLETQLLRDKDIRVIAIKRSQLHYTEKNVYDVKLKIGDILLVRVPVDKLDRFRGKADFIVVEDVHDEIVHKRKAKIAGLIFLGIILSATTGLADIMVCALTGVLAMFVSGCLQMRDAYRALQGKVLLLIAGMIALGAAMEKTGASQFYAEAFVGLFSGLSPQWILGGFILLTSISTQLLSNNATAVLLMPVAISTALGLGVDPKPFIVALCFGASACFATPIGYQTNLLVYAPGSYRFSDYLKLGIPLNLLVLTLGTLFIPVLWPF